jgi:hypothetical protein
MGVPPALQESASYGLSHSRAGPFRDLLRNPPHASRNSNYYVYLFIHSIVLISTLQNPEGGGHLKLKPATKVPTPYPNRSL